MDIDEYTGRLRTPVEAVIIVKSGDWVEYPSGTNFRSSRRRPAKSREELTVVKVRGQSSTGHRSC